MKASQIIERYEAFCPQDLSLEGDISGLQIGTLDKEIDKVMIALDVREATVKEAIEKKVDLLIVKHAPIFRPLQNLKETAQNQIYFNLIKHDIAVYVSHTNIDIVPGGLNDWFCDLLDVSNREILSPSKDNDGIGRVGDIAPLPFETLAQKVKKVFELDSIRLVSYREENPLISRIAICGGSGQSFYKEALAKGAQVYITGDIYYHTAQEMLTNGLLALDPGHHIEVLFVAKLCEKFQMWSLQEKWDVAIIESQANTNPFSHL
ncbi:Nif3-like dinuclear metal center hexameric protein [Streptococcus macacae]|uniref:GTP cyclohydrolase 1 type 2 homolog n=1 Tax=Streptococcus macacae NCTC 11558 TaxID=764298 RepID=G5JVN8_9STRE|nr:Nif3-like dinuclear metal center hexameric protein [Streptococcus macacae]EHJ52418.1 dinuclear metal center protein, YbgI family [Streptococcus macacae NCTC 11558]SUN78706.1 dinuclear metal center protein, YbgI/SA1388family [Streptococcus macacae NCTC 11558]